MLAAASGASAGLIATPSYLNDNKVYPLVVGGDGSSYVDVAVRWAPHLLRRGASTHTMKVTLTGRGRRGAPLRFDSETIRKGSSRIQVVRLNVRKKQRGAFAHARSVVVSSSHHWSRGKATNDWYFPTSSNLVAVSNANVSGRVGRNPFTARTPQECDVATLGPNVTATNCDFTGANLSGADLRGANFAGSVFDQGNLAGANLSGANLTSTSMVGTNIAGTDFGDTSQAAFTMPQAADPSQGTSAVCKQTGGGPMCEAIYAAKSTVGAVYYQFAGPNVTRWLKDALLRGVDVWVIENSANTTPGSNASNPLCQTVSATDPACAWSPKADPFYALEAQLKSVVKSDGSTGQVRVQFSSQNFNITHQKSILVDVLDANGTALDAGTIQSQGGFAVVSTGNLQAYPNSWGQRTISGKLANVDYLTNPSATCTGGTDAGCDKEWTPRDFAMRVTDPAVLARIAGVYASDLRCDPSNVTNVQSKSASGTLVPGLIADPRGSDPISAQWPETWSNGSTYYAGDPMPPNQQAWNYPFPGLYPNGYFAYGDDTAVPPTQTYLANFITGNVRARQVALINAAKKTLVVYNEEMSDFKKPYSGKPVDVTAPSIVNALIGAGQRGVKVTIVMANDFWTPVKGGPSVPDSNAPSWAAEFNALTDKDNFTQAGAVVPTIMLLDENGPLYIHGKAIVADGVDGWFGSINASSGSMNTNRELGLGVTNRSGSTPYVPAVYSPQMIAAVTSSAATDSAAGTSWTKAQPQPKAKSSGYLSSAQFPCINTRANAASGLPPRDPNNVAAPPQAPVTPPTR
jgi:uncharacterized protein YjbI with pentapeptide repeats